MLLLLILRIPFFCKEPEVSCSNLSRNQILRLNEVIYSTYRSYERVETLFLSQPIA